MIRLQRDYGDNEPLRAAMDAVEAERDQRATLDCARRLPPLGARWTPLNRGWPPYWELRDASPAAAERAKRDAVRGWERVVGLATRPLVLDGATEPREGEGDR